MPEISTNTGKEFSPSSPDEEAYAAWVALAQVKGLGCASFKKVADHFGDPRLALSSSEGELAQVPDLDRGAIEGLLTFSEWDGVRNEIRHVVASGVDILPFNAPSYPARLRVITDPPPFLYVRGEIREEDQWAVAVVGSRSASDYGLRITRDLCQGLASLGLTVVSGMARGIDGEAHEASLEAGGRTVAVLGSGVDVVYPPEHGTLYQNISRAGAIISELPMGTPPFSFNFPPRNRLISALSLGVVVVEATEKSGSLITAGLALDQGREVFAVPGEAGTSRSRGTHRLIRQGAKLVENVEDIVEEIAPQLLVRARVKQPDPVPPLPLEMNSEVRKVCELVLEQPVQIDEVIQKSGLSSAKVSGILLDLEIKGLLRQLPGKRFMASPQVKILGLKTKN
ncbi:MAG: DNA-processing protein DprA [Candidatus Binatia bacterium]